MRLSIIIICYESYIPVKIWKAYHLLFQSHFLNYKAFVQVMQSSLLPAFLLFLEDTSSDTLAHQVLLLYHLLHSVPLN